MMIFGSHLYMNLLIPNLDIPEPKEKIIQNAKFKMQSSKLTHWKLITMNEFNVSIII